MSSISKIPTSMNTTYATTLDGDTSTVLTGQNIWTISTQKTGFTVVTDGLILHITESGLLKTEIFSNLSYPVMKTHLALP